MTRISNDTNDSIEIRRRLGIAKNALEKMKPLWKAANKSMKLAVLRTCIFPAATYGAESWTIKQDDAKRIRAFENKCYRKILRVPWIIKRTNESIKNELDIKGDLFMSYITKQRLTREKA